MKRRLFNLLAVASLALCVATVVLWPLSYWRSFTLDTLERVSLRNPEARRYVFPFTGINRGQFIVGYNSYDFSPGHQEPEYDFTGSELLAPDSLKPTEFRFLGFEYESHPYFILHADRMIQIPMWFLFLVFAVYPSIIASRTIRQRRRQALIRHKICPSCGYDLRATPDRCPECGSVS